MISKEIKNRIEWYLRQLLPLQYRTTYHEGNQKVLTIWRMWFGRSFNIENYKLSE